MKPFGLSLRLPLSLAAATLLGLGCGAERDLPPQSELGDEERITGEIRKLQNGESGEWFKVRQALEKYQDVTVALAEGYINSGICVQTADGAAMGVHFFRKDLMDTPTSDLYQPEILLYLPEGVGGVEGYTLLGPEYWQADTGQPTPSLLKQPFDGPMPGHDPWMPVHYDLHVWLFKYNEDGLFGGFNARAKCPEGFPTQTL